MAGFLLALSDIKLAHSVFALPFAVLAAVLASPMVRGVSGGGAGGGEGWGRLGGQVGLIVLCMFLARTWAMLVNRIADWRFDKENPRTAQRAIASGRLSEGAAVRIAGGFGAAFVAATGLFWVFFANPWPLALSVPVLGWIALYSFTKRFTAWCHVFLGGALAASPLAAAIAIEPSFLFSGEGKGLWLLAGMVLCWVAGFDIPYAVQDVEVDRRLQLHSAPARLGVGTALWISRVLHVSAFGLLVGFALTQPRIGGVFWGAVAAVGVLLVVEHGVLWRRGSAARGGAGGGAGGGLPPVFFTVNGLVSLTLGLAGCWDVLNG
ncbi:MAG: UbiA-like polyprenyltransferase [Phycisphaerales bacterium]